VGSPGLGKLIFQYHSKGSSGGGEKLFASTKFA
jgi:hypothetical protein